ncbi:MAG: class I SAM-dependent methyltransferase [Planctomycetota bacterium]
MTPLPASLKARLKATCMAGGYGRVAKSIERHPEEFAGRLRIRPGPWSLDIACGTGNIAIPAARAGMVVTGVDSAPHLLEQAREPPTGANVRFEQSDAETLRYPDVDFDLVVTMYGAMFARRHDRVAAELVAANVARRRAPVRRR